MIKTKKHRVGQKKDNGHLRIKLGLRRRALQAVDHPLAILETHGGFGNLYTLCGYAKAEIGAVMEKDPKRAEALAAQRPTWAVYNGDAAKLLMLGAASHFACTLLDIDPYGSPFETMAAFFGSDRPFAPKLLMVVTDGMASAIRTRRVDVEILREVSQVIPYAEMFDRYGEVARWMVERLSSKAGYTLTRFNFYRARRMDMAYYVAELRSQ